MPHTSVIRQGYTSKFVLLLALLSAVTGVDAVHSDEPRFIDHSLLGAPEYPATWPSAPFPRFQITHQRTIGPELIAISIPVTPLNLAVNPPFVNILPELVAERAEVTEVLNVSQSIFHSLSFVASRS